MGRLVLLLALFPGAAWAQNGPSLSGHVWNQTAGTPLQDAVVRIWKRIDSKSWNIVQIAETDSNGLWASSALTSGTYTIECGPPDGGPQLASRWYDAATPNAQGWAWEDADQFTTGTYTNLDVTLPLSGGFDAYVVDGSTPIGNVQGRLVRSADPRVHHNDQTRGGPHLGRFYMRSLVPATDYRLLLYDPTGAHGLTQSGPYTVSALSNTAATIDLDAPPNNPNEPNGSAAASGAFSVDGDGLHAAPPVAWETSAVIGSVGDLDWYCWEGQVGDRYIASTTSEITVATHTIANPWLDPMVSFWQDKGQGFVRLVQDDDSGPDRDARLDTFDVPDAGDVCMVVTTYGDGDFNGSGQQSVGTYDLRIEMGNRRPLVFVTRDGDPVPPPPDSTVVAEDEQIELVATFVDPEGDALWATATFVDASGDDVVGWTFDLVGDTATITWTPDQQAAQYGPYVLGIEAGDDELSAITEVIVAVATVNIPPEAPEALAPLQSETVTDSFPELTVINGSDIDGDTLYVEFETYTDPSGPVYATDTILAGSTNTSWTMPFVADATTISWRARMFDGELYSAWTPMTSFLVATYNDPPAVPVLEKPSLGETVLTRHPALSALDSADPENDDVSLVVQVAFDTTFATPVTTGDPVLEDAIGPTTAWTVDVDLPWGEVAYWRAMAVDEHGAGSEWSAPSYFRVKDNVVPTSPTFGTPWGPTCQDVLVHTAPTTFPIGNAVDPEGEPMTLEVQVFEGDADTDDPPLATATVPQSAGAITDVPLTASFTEDTRYRVQARASDGTDVSEWVSCDFWIDLVDAPTLLFAIEEPVEGDLIPADVYVTDARVTNPTDDDADLPGSTMDLAWCLEGNDATCADTGTWNHTAFQTGQWTIFQVSGLVPDEDWVLHACAMDQRGACKATDTAGFRTVAPLGGGDDTGGGNDDTGGGGDDEGKCGCGGGPVGPVAWLAALLVLGRRRR